MRRWLWRLWPLLFATACRPPAAPPPTIISTPPAPTLHIGVSDSATALTDLVAEPYARQTDRAILQFIPGNNTTLFADLISGQLDALLVHHIPENSPGWFSPVALDGLVIVVHPDNQVQELSLGEVQAVFNGRISNWSALGGNEKPITLVSRERGAGTRAIFQQRIMAEQRISINALIQPGNRALLAAVAADLGAIGVAMMGSAEGVNLLAIDGISPTPTETAVQNYPLTIPLYFVSPDEPIGELRAFLAWLQSEEGQSVIGERYGRVK